MEMNSATSGYPPRDGYMIADRKNLSFSSSSASGSTRDVNYSCGSCGYELNLSSSNRNTSTIGSKYRKSLKRGVISFLYIDESRFTQVDQFQCMPYFIAKHSWSLFRPKTKLLCRKCGKHVGYAYEDPNLSYYVSPDVSDSTSGNNETSVRKKYSVKIRALQPSSSTEFGVPLIA